MAVKNVTLLLIALLLLPQTVQAGPGAFLGVEKGQACGENENFKACRKRMEDAAIKSFSSRVSRSGVNLSLRLNDGKTKIYKDEAANLDGALCGYRFITYLSEADFYLIDQQCETDHTYRFVSAMDGKTKATGTEYPKVSPAGDKILMMDADRQLKLPLFQVFTSPKKGAMAFEAKIELKALNGIYWPNNLFSQWKDANTALLADAQGQEFGKNILGMAQYNGQKWAVVIDSASVQKRKQDLGGGSQSNTPTTSTNTPSIAGKYFINDGHMKGEMEIKSLGGNSYSVNINSASSNAHLCDYEGKGVYKDGSIVIKAPDNAGSLVMKVSGKVITVMEEPQFICGASAYLSGKYARK